MRRTSAEGTKGQIINMQKQRVEKRQRQQTEERQLKYENDINWRTTYYIETRKRRSISKIKAIIGTTNDHNTGERD